MAQKSKKKRRGGAGGRRIRGARAFLHPHLADEPWRALPWLLLGAFALRAAVSLSSDFVLHPDEIMQYLEPARRAVFGEGVVYWEYFYGGRSWLVPGLAAAVLWIFKTAGLDSPSAYIPAVKLMFCALSLLIPWGMYDFCRRHWNEHSARFALVAGVFWYELAVFAHKPFTEFVAAGLLLLLMALGARIACASPLFPSSTDSAAESPPTPVRVAALAGAAAVLLAAVRMQYIPAAALVALAAFWAADRRGKGAMALGGLAVLAAVGALEWATWGSPFHSYHVNTIMNIMVGSGREGESSALVFPAWLALASCGLVLPAVFGVFSHFRRRGFVLALVLLLLIPHMLQNHREYRFIFAIVPLWLLLFADFVSVLAMPRGNPRPFYAGFGALAACISVLGAFNWLPLQNSVYVGFSRESGYINFLHNHDPMFRAYNHLAGDNSVRGVLDVTRPYFNTGGYYYLGHAAPFYDIGAWHEVVEGDIEDYASHIVTFGETPSPQIITSGGRPVLRTTRGLMQLPAIEFDSEANELAYWSRLGKRRVTDYEEDAQFDGMRVWKIRDDSRAQREWKSHVVTNASIIGNKGYEKRILRNIFGSDIPQPPPNLGIEFKEE